MTTEIDLRHPTKGDYAQGRYIEDNGDQFYIISWWHFDGKSFGGVLTTWAVSDWDIRLDDVFTRDPREDDWRKVDDEHKAGYVPNRHKRLARELGRERFKVSQFYRLRL